MNLITQQAELSAFCARVAMCAVITVDTEFLRDKTYFPKLCLLQIASPDEAAAIDPLSPGIDLAPVFALMQQPDLLKVFHAARQDIEIFFLLSGQIPTPVFDTQVAASACGYGESVSYETLVNKIVGAELDKSSRFTDWSSRPLSAQQLHYALSDVTHLRVIYQALKSQIDQAGRTSWIDEEQARLTDPAIYNANPEDAWKRLKFGTMRPKHLAVLRELAKWRELEARKHDVPRGRIVKDETLLELAAAIPRKEADLTRLRGIDKQLGKARLDAIFHGIQTALALPQSEWPQIKHHKRASENTTSAVALLQLLLKVTADLHLIASSIIAGKDDLEAIALGQDTPALHGWRHDIFGRQAAALMQGKLTLSWDAENKQVAFTEQFEQERNNG